MMRSAKVDDFDGTPLIDVNQDVLRLQVPVSNIFAVAVSDGLQDLLGHVGRLLLRKLLTSRDLVEELTPVTQFCDEEDTGIALIDLEQADNARVVQVLEDIDLILHADTLSWVHLEFVNDFDGTQLSVCLQGGLLDFAEGTFAEEIVVQLVLAQEYSHILML